MFVAWITCVSALIFGWMPVAGAGPSRAAVQHGFDKLPTEAAAGHGFTLRAYSDDHYRRRFSYSVGGKSVRHQRSERGAPTDPWTTWSAEESTSYLITGVASFRGGDELLVAGLTYDGFAVIERWTYPPRRNGWYAFAPPVPGTLPAGAALPAAVAERATADGGPWQAPPSSYSLGSAERRPLLKLGTGPILGLAVDPQGRYLFYHDRELRGLFQLSLLEPTPTPVLLADTTSLPTLDQVGSLQVMDFAGEGRKLLVRRCYLGNEVGADERYTIFADPENDGTFQLSTMLDAAQWKQASYSDFSLWNPYWHP